LARIEEGCKTVQQLTKSMSTLLFKMFGFEKTCKNVKISAYQGCIYLIKNALKQ